MSLDFPLPYWPRRSCLSRPSDEPSDSPFQQARRKSPSGTEKQAVTSIRMSPATCPGWILHQHKGGSGNSQNFRGRGGGHCSAQASKEKQALSHSVPSNKIGTPGQGRTILIFSSPDTTPTPLIRQKNWDILEIPGISNEQWGRCQIMLFRYCFTQASVRWDEMLGQGTQNHHHQVMILQIAAC